jgi:hypothetical protein
MSESDGAALAAGEAKAKAEDAHDNAEVAVEQSASAKDVADAAIETAWDAQSAVGQLADRVEEGLSSMAARLDELANPKKGADPDDMSGAKPPVKKGADPDDMSGAKPPAKKKGWFNGR